MTNLISVAKKSKNIIKPFDKDTDVLLYYGIVAQKLTKYLKSKEIAARNWLPPGGFPQILKRGSKEPPLWIEDFAKGADYRLLEARKQYKALKDAKGISPLQKNIWSYFIPRKLSDFFYATNGEHPGGKVERIFFDLDIGSGQTAKNCQIVAKALAEEIRKEAAIHSFIRSKPFVMWTGKSFHVYIFLKKPQPNSLYVKYFQFNKSKPELGVIGKWCKAIEKQTKIKTRGGHEKVAGAITIDPSQTPSGKLCRAPFSLHMSDWKTVDGVAIPLKLSQLSDRNLVSKLQKYTPEKVVKELNILAMYLP